MKRYMLSLLCTVAFYTTISHGMDSGLSSILSFINELIEDQKICGICKNDNEDETGVTWPSRCGSYVHTACFENVQASEKPIVTLLKEHFTKNQQITYQKIFHNAWQDACGNLSLHEYQAKHGGKSLKKLGILCAGLTLHEACNDDFHEKQHERLKWLEMKSFSPLVVLEKLEMLREEQKNIVDFMKKYKALHDLVVKQGIASGDAAGVMD